MTDDLEAGLRCQDIHAGLRNVDPNSAALAPLADTRVVGMAASLASLLRGQDIVPDAEALLPIVAEQLDISPYAFSEVVNTLEQSGFVHGVQRRGRKVVGFTESIPYYENLYSTLGRTWRAGEPNQLEQEFVAVVDRLATSPVPAEDLGSQLGLDPGDVPRLIELGTASELIQCLELPHGAVLYSPFFGFENPEALGALFESHGNGRFADELHQVRGYQGLPITRDSHPAIADAVARGLIAAPSVRTPDGVDQAFATLPYVPDHKLLTMRKPVLEKALAVLACVRCGQHFGGVTATRSPARVLDALLDPDRDHTLGAHSSHLRQYQLLYRMQIVDFLPSGSWVKPRLIVTDDNLEAVGLARDLLLYGEPMTDRTGDDQARELLSLNARYESPIQAVGRSRGMKSLNVRDYQDLMDAAMGRAPL